jgi:transposase
MAGKRRAFTDAFKAEAVRLVTVDGHPVSQVAKELDIHGSLLRRWQRKLDARRAREVGVKPPLAVAASAIVEQDEIRRLKRENERLRMERDILKKTVAIFSETPT